MLDLVKREVFFFKLFTNEKANEARKRRYENLKDCHILGNPS